MTTAGIRTPTTNRLQLPDNYFNEKRRVYRQPTCELPGAMAYFNQETGECFFSGPGAVQYGCPDGWVVAPDDDPAHGGTVDPTETLADGKPLGCFGFKKVPKCLPSFATTSTADKARCCLENTDGSFWLCPPGFCRAKIASDACYEAIRTSGACFKDPKSLFLNDACRAWVLDEKVRTGPHAVDIQAGVQRMCKEAGRFGASDPLCKCILANEEQWCRENECFARQHRALTSVATCLAKPCLTPEDQGTFIPLPPPGGCAKNVCAQKLQYDCASIESESALITLVGCGCEDLPLPSGVTREEFIKKTGLTEAQIQQQISECKQGRASVLTVVGDAAVNPWTTPLSLPPPGDGDGTSSGGSSNASSNGDANKNGSETESEPLPSWFWPVVGSAIALGVILVIVAIVVGVRRSQKNKTRPLPETRRYNEESMPLL